MVPDPKGTIERYQHNKRSEIPRIARFARARSNHLRSHRKGSPACTSLRSPIHCQRPSSARHTQALKMEKENVAEEPWIEVKRGERLARAGRDQPKQYEGDEKRYKHEG
jgi:hypothetical protein